MSTYLKLVLGGAISLIAAGLTFAVVGDPRKAGGATKADSQPTNESSEALHPVLIRKPAGPPRVHTGRTNFAGEAVMASCSSCHATTRPNFEIQSSAELEEFHQGLNFAHGNLACLSCHNSKNYDTLQLATGKPVEFSDVMTLCAQCHGPQTRDYNNGSHGGMTGHWDLRQGPRERNNCINCHDPHAPAYPLAMPVFPPQDRGSTPKATH